MSAILDAVTSLVSSAVSWVTPYLNLMFTWSDAATPAITGISVLGFFCMVLPLVGLGIGIIRRVVSVRM